MQPVPVISLYSNPVMFTGGRQEQWGDNGGMSSDKLTSIRADTADILRQCHPEILFNHQEPRVTGPNFTNNSRAGGGFLKSVGIF